MRQNKQMPNAKTTKAKRIESKTNRRKRRDIEPSKQKKNELSHFIKLNLRNVHSVD